MDYITKIETILIYNNFRPNGILERESALFSSVWESPTVRNLEIQNLL